jgi:hypothetical protein
VKDRERLTCTKGKNKKEIYAKQFHGCARRRRSDDDDEDDVE